MRRIIPAPRRSSARSAQVTVDPTDRTGRRTGRQHVLQPPHADLGERPAQVAVEVVARRLLEAARPTFDVGIERLPGTKALCGDPVGLVLEAVLAPHQATEAEDVRVLAAGCDE